MVAPIIGTVISQKQWAKNLFSIRVAADIDPYQPGQFGRIGLPIGADNAPIMRPYSFVSVPQDDYLEFYYSVVLEGELTPHLPPLKAGDEIFINQKVNGYLVLAEVPAARDLWLLSTGTGIGPFISILKSQEPWARFSNVVLVHAVRYEGDLSYQEDIEAIGATAKELGSCQFQYVPFVSRTQVAGAMHGRIPDAIANNSLFNQTGMTIAPEHSQFMLCGNPGMVDDTIALLKEQGFARNRRRTPGHITMESYW